MRGVLRSLGGRAGGPLTPRHGFSFGLEYNALYQVLSESLGENQAAESYSRSWDPGHNWAVERPNCA